MRTLSTRKAAEILASSERLLASPYITPERAEQLRHRASYMASYLAREGCCRSCGRRLENPKSVARGYGRECIKAVAS